jgi:hypothetical protein
MALKDKVGSKAYWNTVTDVKKYMLCENARDKDAADRYRENYERIFRKGRSKAWKDTV